MPSKTVPHTTTSFYLNGRNVPRDFYACFSSSSVQNLRNHLLRAKVNTLRNFVPPSCGPCNRFRCQLCILWKSDSRMYYIVSHTTGQKHHLYCTAGANCSSTKVIYCLTCDTFGIQYVCYTNTLRWRLNNQKSCIRPHRVHPSPEFSVSTNITFYLPVTISNV